MHKYAFFEKKYTKYFVRTIGLSTFVTNLYFYSRNRQSVLQ